MTIPAFNAPGDPADEGGAVAFQAENWYTVNMPTHRCRVTQDPASWQAGYDAAMSDNYPKRLQCPARGARRVRLCERLHQWPGRPEAGCNRQSGAARSASYACPRNHGAINRRFVERARNRRPCLWAGHRDERPIRRREGFRPEQGNRARAIKKRCRAAGNCPSGHSLKVRFASSSLV